MAEPRAIPLIAQAANRMTQARSESAPVERA
jgi:hypothetical protein